MKAHFIEHLKRDGTSYSQRFFLPTGAMAPALHPCPAVTHAGEARKILRQWAKIAGLPEERYRIVTVEVSA